MKKFFIAAALVVAIFSSVACGAPVLVTDVLGREMTVEVPAQRIVLTFNFEEYVAVTGSEGLSKIVGWARKYWQGRRQSTWDAFAVAFPQIKDIPDVGYIPKNTFNVEAVMALQPDVVFMAKNDARKVPDEVERLTGAGIPVVFVDYHDQTLENHVQSTLLFGCITGHELRARELADWYAAEANKVYDRVLSLVERPKVYMEFSGDVSGPAAIGSTWGRLMWGGIIERCGGDNIACDLVLGSDAPISPEQVLRSDPDVIILAGNYRSDEALNVGLGYEAKAVVARARLEGYRARAGWDNLKAIRKRRMGAIYHDLSRHIFDAAGIQFIAKMIHPEVFSDLDPQATLQGFYDRFFPVPLTGAFMVTLDQ